MNRTKQLIKNVDWLFLALLFIILSFNLVVLSSASANVVIDAPYYHVYRQLMWIIAGFFLMLIIARIDYHIYPKLYIPAYIFINILLIAVLFTPEKKGASRWFDLGFMDLQPSELAKLIIIVAFACFIAKNEGKLNLPRNLAALALSAVIPFALIFIEPDLGTSLVFIAILMAMAWVGGVSPRVLLTLVLIMVLVIGLMFGVLYNATGGFQNSLEDGDLPSWFPLKAYQASRLIIFINPNMDPLGKGYHMIQSEVAIGSGGLLGKGYGQGSQVQGNFLPEHHTDFIFSVVGEEFGFVGSAGILFFYLLLLVRAVRIAYNAKDILGMSIVTGVTAMLLFQVFTNAGMTIGIMPITGIPFPLLSYGGSAMLVNMMALGLVFSVNVHSRVNLF